MNALLAFFLEILAVLANESASSGWELPSFCVSSNFCAANMFMSNDECLDVLGHFSFRELCFDEFLMESASISQI